ncbi:MAG: undecaprenyl-diphosphate phosphatase [Chitinispirillales bacterium]|jgi:undecaprenyl-diphosphatase|nr:undecaprenyl-diphosphate phosphatase [Chitinispirillales bacterium]
MELIKTVLLGIIQGLTEFLPVSSSGHLILAETFLNVQNAGIGSNMLIEVILHLGTGIAVLYVFRKDILSLITGAVSSDTVRRKESLTYCGWIILATIPAAVIGIGFKKQIDVLFDTTQHGNMAAYLASAMLLVTAALLFFSSKHAGKGGGKLTLAKAAAIGLMQAAAIIPGISRSGSTIAIALLVGVSREEAGRFSFMLALPAIFGAALLDARHISSIPPDMALNLILGFIASLAVGVAALKLLLSFIKKGKLHYFAYYCVAAAIISLACLTFFPSLTNRGGM